jgi:hypothetical protein
MQSDVGFRRSSRPHGQSAVQLCPRVPALGTVRGPERIGISSLADRVRDPAGRGTQMITYGLILVLLFIL